MKKFACISLVGGFIIGFSACKTPSKTTVDTPASPPPVQEGSVSNPWMGSETSVELPKGVYSPTMAELSAILPHFQDATMDQLNQGFQLYTAGACINCHKAKNISRHSVTEWKQIMDDMAQKAEFNQAQKDAVYRYVLSIKATANTRN
ncbi:MAG: hypothetical protein K1X82_03825 [Bacteroidia bacterium]|nr:hypothetical protein [Bacteroidia bacterium]